MSGELWVDVQAQPATLHFGELQPSKVAVRPLTLKITEPDKVKVDKVTIDDERFTIARASRSNPDQRAQAAYDVSFGGQKAFGAIEARLAVEYTGPDGPSKVYVPIFGRVVGNLRYPRRVFFRKVGGAYPSERLVVAHRSDGEVRILSGRDPEGRVTVKVLPAKNNQAVVELTVTNPMGGKTTRGTLELKTNDALEPLLTIPYDLQLSYRRTSRSRAQGAVKAK